MPEQLVLEYIETQAIKALRDRQDQFAALLRVEPEQLRHLQFCGDCGGYDYQWTDWTISPLPMLGFIKSREDATDYRNYLAESACKSCDASGFEGGSFEFEIEQWLTLGQSIDIS
jgi:hypothetical protein